MNKIDICNQALMSIGGELITSLDENSQEARLCKTIFTTSLQTLLEEHEWNFATKRAALARAVATPLYDYDYAYPLPSDCLRVIEFQYQDDYDFVIEDDMVLTNVKTCKIKYIYEVEDMNKLSSMFRQALISFLAATLAPYLTNTAPYAQGAAQQFMLYMRKAKTYNARESKKTKSTDGDWLDVRVGG